MPSLRCLLGSVAVTEGDQAGRLGGPEEQDRAGTEAPRGTALRVPRRGICVPLGTTQKHGPPKVRWVLCEDAAPSELLCPSLLSQAAPFSS